VKAAGSWAGKPRELPVKMRSSGNGTALCSWRAQQRKADAILIRLLGPFEIARPDGTVCSLPGRKDRALLAYLALTRDVAHPRDRLAALLWPDHDDAHGRDSLKHALARIRAALTEDAGALETDRDRVRLSARIVQTDVALFEAASQGPDPALLEQALGLYRGPLFADTAATAPDFADWLGVERERLKRRAEAAAAALINAREAAGQSEAVVAAAETALAIDALSECAVRALMRVHAGAGERSRALRLFETLRERLRAELDAEPEPETRRLHEEIRTNGAAPVPVAAGSGSPPTIAVLAFETLGGAAADDYFADGIVEEVITALSRMKGIIVIARASSFAFKGATSTSAEIGNALGVRYLIDGTIRREADHLRIHARLTEATGGTLLWSERFESGMADLFDVQEQIAASIVGQIAPSVVQAEIDRSARKTTANLDAYDLYLRGLAAFHRYTRESNLEAVRFFARAWTADPGFAAAYGMAIRSYSQRLACGWMVDHHAEMAEVRKLVRLAVDHGANDAIPLATAGIGLSFLLGEMDQGGLLIDRALELNPNLAMTWFYSAWHQIWFGRPEVAIEHARRAMRLSPRDPQFAMMQTVVAAAEFFRGHEDRAAEIASGAVLIQPNYWIAWCVLAASRAQLGDAGAAREAMSSIRAIDPQLRLGNLRRPFPIREPTYAAKWHAALRGAGLPD
jgi:TolB-like protein